MNIRTDTKENIFTSFENIFLCPSSTIKEFSKTLYNGCLENGCINLGLANEKIKKFIKNNIISTVDSIQIHHLSRRLNSENEDNKVCNNLYELLTYDSLLAQFLKTFGIKFKKNNGSIQLFYNDNEMVPNTDSSLSCRVRVRLGLCNKEYRDYCVNGFAFADRIQKNSYYQVLSRGPEFIQDIAKFLKRPDINEKYIEKSTYYLYTYLLPIDRVILSNEDNATGEQSLFKLITVCFQRLAEWFNGTPEKYWTDHNILARLDDSSSLTDKDYFDRRLI
jgi:hypothetical protein